MHAIDRAASERQQIRAARAAGRSVDLLRSELAEIWSRQYGIAVIHLTHFDIPADVVALLPREIAVRFGVLTVNVVGALVHVATHDPSAEALLEAIERFTGFSVEAVVATLPEIDAAITRACGPGP